MTNKEIRNFLLLLTLAMLCTSHACAQHRKHSSSRQFDFELRGGINFCQIDGDASANYNKIGFHGAFNTSFPLGDDDRWRFLVEIGVTQKGSRIENSTLDRRISLLYVEVPLMIAYDLLGNKQLRFAVGIAPAILAHANVTSDGAYDPAQSNNYKRFDLLPVCVTLRYRITDHLGFSFHYYNSLLNTAIENGTGTFRIFRSNKGQFNRLLQAGLSVSF